MKKILTLLLLSSFLSVSYLAVSSPPRKPKKSNTQKRIKKQEKQRKKHDCPQLDC